MRLKIQRAVVARQLLVRAWNPSDCQLEEMWTPMSRADKLRLRASAISADVSTLAAAGSIIKWPMP